MKRLDVRTSTPGVPATARLAELIDAAPEPQDILWARRNLLFAVAADPDDPDGEQWVVKRFSRCFPTQIVYAIRASKARRSFLYAGTLAERGIETPFPVACAERRGPLNLLLDSIYISRRDNTIPLGDAITAAREAGELNALLERFARFAAGMHAAGCIHNDLNLTNVRVEFSDHGPLFSVIDLNRMRIWPENTIPSLEIRFKDLTRWSRLDDDFIFFLKEYLRESGLAPELLADAVEVKRRHDRRWDRKHRWKKWFRRKK